MPSGTNYSAYGRSFTPSGASVARKMRSYLSYNYSNQGDKVVCSVTAGIQISGGSMNSSTGTMTLSATGQSTSKANGAFKYKGATTVALVSRTYTWTRGTESVYKGIYASFVMPSSSGLRGTYSTSVSIPVPRRTKKVIHFNAVDGTNPPSDIDKYWGIDINIPEEVPTKTAAEFLKWTCGTEEYLAGQLYSVNPTSIETDDENPTEMVAEYTWVNAPTCEYGEVYYNRQDYTKVTKNFTPVSVDVSNIVYDEERTFDYVRFYVGSAYTDKTTTTDGTISVTPTESGELNAKLVLKDIVSGTDGAVREYDLGTVTVDNPTWTRNATFTTLLPDVDIKENSKITVKAKNFDTSTETDVYDTISGNFKASGTSGNWSVSFVLTEEYIPTSQRSSANPTGTSIKVTYDHSEKEEKYYREAFFNTTRNSNYSNGISGNMFVGGVINKPNFASRVWWSYVNNPLYFPDTNYVEVGSNDTSVMGLIKVGDYLGAIKQSKTTDTAIYLLYPTSFDDETTYAIKQGVQGIGALGKYSFNILGDETLFLSPNGVMAIVPSEDEEHKVQNRSFYVDGQLLKEPNLEDSYSFVFDGKYYLSVNSNCYVLDGNQKNSWGNDKTNLVYECYYLENVPADCFVKYNNELWFNNSEYLCRIKEEGDLNPYVDSRFGDEVDVPVKAEWSTILDDDGSLHYYKTMNKKGNVVSVLPRASEHTEVLIKKDNEEPVLIQRTFSEASDIPSELYVNKKFKKYKRLQIIVRNEKAEGFGVDSIVKSYSLGSYAKR